jgi:hypothetical protein
VINIIRDLVIIAILLFLAGVVVTVGCVYVIGLSVYRVHFIIKGGDFNGFC